jgi:hypothetical protein
VNRLLAALFRTTLSASPVAAADTKPNIVLILADDIGINGIGCSGVVDGFSSSLF